MVNVINYVILLSLIDGSICYYYYVLGSFDFVLGSCDFGRKMVSIGWFFCRYRI